MLVTYDPLGYLLFNSKHYFKKFVNYMLGGTMYLTKFHQNEKAFVNI